MIDPEKRLAVRLLVHGRVQGVGFRYWTVCQADELAIVGTVRNLADGTVEAVAEGSAHALDDFLLRLQKGPIAAKVVRIERTSIDPISARDFKILR